MTNFSSFEIIKKGKFKFSIMKDFTKYNNLFISCLATRVFTLKKLTNRIDARANSDVLLPRNDTKQLINKLL